MDSTENLDVKYKQILKDNGITEEVSEITETSPPDLKGAGMTSKPLYVTVKFKNPTVKSLNLFVKLQVGNESQRAVYESMKLCEKEVRFLTKYVPAVQEFCELKGMAHLVDIYPKFYYADNDMVVLENLTSKGYILLSKQERQGLESARVALTTLAKHHAMSYAFIKESGGAEAFFERFPNFNYDLFSGDNVKAMVEPLVENGIATNIKLLQKSNVVGKEDAVKILEAHAGKAFSLMIKTLNFSLEQEILLTLNHGDYWNNNMMFLQDEKTNGYIDHVILDFQCLRYNSPALDFGNFMYTSMKPETRREHLQELLELYLDTLQTTASDLGHPIELSYNELRTLLRKKMKYGFWFAIWLAVEVGYAVINDVYDDEGGVDEDWSVKFDRLVQKWIDKNPEKSEQCAKDLVDLMKEYSDLAIE